MKIRCGILAAGLGVALATHGQVIDNVVQTISDPLPAVEALALFDAGDKLGFLKALESPDIQQAVLEPELREELLWRQAAALLHFRRFDDCLEEIETFRSQFPTSACADEMAERRLVALWEKGMAKVRESLLPFQDEERFQRRWAEGATPELVCSRRKWMKKMS